METRKDTHTKEEILELKEWLEQATLPESLQVDKATYIPHLQTTLESLYKQAEYCYNNPKMQGCIYLLERIKQRLEEGHE